MPKQQKEPYDRLTDQSRNEQQPDRREGSLIPAITPSYVPWGHHDDVEKFVRNNDFTTLYVTGLSGNGKTTMVEQACANANRECIRANITAETDEDDLIGGFRLHNGSTVFVYGAAIEAMKRGAVLLLDEVDLASERIMCLQPVLRARVSSSRRFRSSCALLRGL